MPLTRSPYLPLLLILVFAAALRLPYVDHGLPFVFDHDEAIHLNHTVEMLQTGDLNPKGFQKPAMLYLRLPITALAFLKSVRNGESKSLRQIKTRSHYDRIGHEYTASHPILFRYNRLFSVLIALASIWMIYEVAALCGYPLAGLLAAFLLSISSGHHSMSVQVGPDISTLLVCLFVLYLSIAFLRSSAWRYLWLAAICAGLAAAFKYSLAFAISIPFASFALRPQAASTDAFSQLSPGLRLFSVSLLLLLCCCLGFLLGNPFALLAVNEFVNGIAVEVWHYGRTGNETSALAAAKLYLGWLASGGVGRLSFAAAILAFAYGVIASSQKRIYLLLAVFPLLHLLLMSNQKLHFVRNMLVVIPFLLLMVCLALAELQQQLKNHISSPRLRACYHPLAFATLCAILLGNLAIPQAVHSAYAMRDAVRSQSESRMLAAQWLRQTLRPEDRVVMAGELQMPHDLRRDKRISQFRYSTKPKGQRFVSVWRKGYRYAVVPGALPANKYSLAARFPGGPFTDKLAHNPEVNIIDLGSKSFEGLALAELRRRSAAGRARLATRPAQKSDCSDLLDADRLGLGWGDSEQTRFLLEGVERSGYRWITERYAQLQLTPCIAETTATSISFAAFSPWPQQRLKVYLNETMLEEISLQERQWARYTVSIPPELRGHSKAQLEFSIAKVGNLRLAGLGRDNRELGVAIHQPLLKR